MIKDDILNKYYDLFNKREWHKAEEILMTIYNPDKPDFWILTSISSLKYEQRDYKKALYYVEKAMTINPESPLVLWDYAGVLYALDKKEEAIIVWNKIIGYGYKSIAFELTTEGVKWAKSLINDCHFRIGQSYFYLGNKDKSIHHTTKHLSERKRGQMSLYSKKKVKIFLEKIMTELK